MLIILLICATLIGYGASCIVEVASRRRADAISAHEQFVRSIVPQDVQ